MAELERSERLVTEKYNQTKVTSTSLFLGDWFAKKPRLWVKAPDAKMHVTEDYFGAHVGTDSCNHKTDYTGVSNFQLTKLTRNSTTARTHAQTHTHTHTKQQQQQPIKKKKNTHATTTGGEQFGLRPLLGGGEVTQSPENSCFLNTHFRCRLSWQSLKANASA